MSFIAPPTQSLDDILADRIADIVATAVTSALTNATPQLTRSVNEAALLLGVSTRALRALIDAGELDLLPGSRYPRVTTVSLYRYAGWPIHPAHLALEGAS